MDCLLTGTPENIIDPPYFGDMSDAEIYAARLELFDEIQCGAAWDENEEGYRMDMLCDFENIYLQYLQGKIARQEIAGLMSDAFDENVWAYCESEIA